VLLLGLAACDAGDIPSQPSELPAPPIQATKAADIIFVSNTWATRPDMSVRRFGLATAAVGTVLYAIGGMSEYEHPYSLVEAYETKAGALGAWVPRTVLPSMLAHFNGAAVIDGKIYVPGGKDAMGTPAASLFVYTPGTNSWTSRKPMPKPGFGGGAVAIDGKLYVVTNPGDGTRSVLFRYTPATDQWAVLAQPYKNLKGAVLGVINGKLYAAGGYKSMGQFSDALLVYDPAKNTWTSKASMPVPRYYGAGRVVGGKLYVAGGASQAGSVTGRTDAYDPSSNTWTRRKDMPGPRMEAGAAVANGLLYVIGGLGSSGIHRTTSMYIP
jgi:N-acetylneuraminic acid mutarotase